MGATRRTLALALDEAEAVMKRLPLDDPRRPEIVRRVRAIQDALDALGDDL